MIKSFKPSILIITIFLLLIGIFFGTNTVYAVEPYETPLTHLKNERIAAGTDVIEPPDGSYAPAYALPGPTPINQIFTDPNLAEEIRTTLGKGSVITPVTQVELDSILYLYANFSSIQEIEGMQYLNNLKELMLSYNQISDISQLSTLYYLDELYLDNNPVSSHEPLSHLANLTWLSLYGTGLQETMDLSSLTKLEYLDMGVNQVMDLGPLEALDQLTWLSAFSNQITNMDVVSNFPQLTNLNLYNNQIEIIDAVEGLSHLTTLYMNTNKIKNIAPISGLNTLTTLYLYTNQISDVSPLENLNNLNTFYISGQAIPLPERPFNTTFSINNEVFNVSSNRILPTTISDGGIYVSPDISWDLPAYQPSVTYTFAQIIAVGNTSANFSGTVTQPLINTQAVTFYFNNNSPDFLTKAIEVGALIPEPSTPTFVGHRFTHWNTAIDGNGINWVFTTMAMLDETVTLYAQWQLEYYELSFDLNGGQGEPPRAQTLAFNALAMSVLEPKKEGFVFTGWNAQRNGSGIDWDFSKNTMPDDPVVLYAQWRINGEGGSYVEGLPKTGGYLHLYIALGLLFGSGSLFIFFNRKV